MSIICRNIPLGMSFGVRLGAPDLRGVAMFWIGRFLQLAGLVVSGVGCLIAFDQGTPERTFWAYALVGLVLFWIGHLVIPKR